MDIGHSILWIFYRLVFMIKIDKYYIMLIMIDLCLAKNNNKSNKWILNNLQQFHSENLVWLNDIKECFKTPLHLSSATGNRRDIQWTIVIILSVGQTTEVF